MALATIQAWMKYDLLYWIPRAKFRIAELEPLGRDYPIDDSWPYLSFDWDDKRFLEKTKHMIDEFTPSTDRNDIAIWIIMKLRLKWSCEKIYKENPDAEGS